MAEPWGYIPAGYNFYSLGELRVHAFAVLCVETNYALCEIAAMSSGFVVRVDVG